MFLFLVLLLVVIVATQTHARTSHTIVKTKYESTKNLMWRNIFVAIFSISILLHNKRLWIVITFKLEELHSWILYRMHVNFQFQSFQIEDYFDNSWRRILQWNAHFTQHTQTIATKPHKKEGKSSQTRSLKYIELEMGKNFNADKLRVEKGKKFYLLIFTVQLYIYLSAIFYTAVYSGKICSANFMSTRWFA